LATAASWRVRQTARPRRCARRIFRRASEQGRHLRRAPSPRRGRSPESAGTPRSAGAFHPGFRPRELSRGPALTEQPCRPSNRYKERSLIFPDWDSRTVETLFEVVYRVSSVMKDGGGERGVSFTFRKNLDEMFWFARTPRCDDRDVCGARHGPREGAIETGLHAIGVHRSEQDFSRAEFFAASRPFDG